MEKALGKEKSGITPRTKKLIKKHLFVYGMLLVAILHFCVFYIYVNIDSFLIAFQDQHTGAWGFGNFRLFFDDISLGAQSEVLISLKNTMIYFVVLLATNLFSFLLSYFIYKKIMLWKFFRFVFVIPMIVSGVVLVAVYSNMLTAGGPIDVIWRKLMGDDAPSLIYSAPYATWSIVLFVIWTGLGMNIILFSGAMNRIPESVIEYGKIDGIKPMREMFQIVLPLIAPTFGTIMLLSCINVFGASGPILLFTNGMHETSTIAFWMYEKVIVRQQFGYAAAFGLILTVCSLPIFFLMRWLLKKLPDDIDY
ncbi:carbohydrate ABC transporter permease [Pumilibacter intestinalis]|uniref:carbohydrate ABC transporter permease n=1 Tax=Pumilibacter intestinalis TaxID=2941511 RepID=UPI00203DD6F7|nr:sugar ABC transporter permease [Pumilibacter intestinalis]